MEKNRSDYKKEWYLKNKEKLSNDKKINYQENKNEIIKKSKEYYLKNKEKSIKSSSNYYLNNKEKIKIQRKKYKLENEEKIKKQVEKRKLKTNKNKSIKRKERRLNDPLFKLNEIIRASIGSYFRKNSYFKNEKTIKILGCTFEEFKIHIENQFESWMNWSNHGKYNLNKITWQLDHIVPSSSAKNKDELIKLNHYTNFQPLESMENILKSNKL